MKAYIIVFLLFSINANAQSITDSLAKKIDGVFAPWTSPNSPGGVIGIIRNDSLIYAKGYGMANLEYGIPNSQETVFHMASISKQFTGYAIVLLEKAGKLSLEDDVRKHLSWFPDLKQKITIRHLLNHTSGIRDQWQLLAMSGTRLDDVITQDQIIKLLSRQQALNFTPGEKYMYCNSGFTMLSEIVKSVSGKTLRQFTDSAIFKPLGMNSTHFHDDYTEIEKNRAYSYAPNGQAKYRNSVLSYSNSGATSLFTNMNDLSKWVMNFYHVKVGDVQAIQRLTTKGVLNNGTVLDYALGIAVTSHKGWRQYVHGGSDAGYRTSITVMPDLKMGFIVFGNVANFETNRLFTVANMFVSDTTSKKGDQNKSVIDSSLAILRKPDAVKKYTGNYISAEGNTGIIEIRNNMLMFKQNNSYKLLMGETDGSYSIPNQPLSKCTFSINGKDTLLTYVTPMETFVLKKYTNAGVRTDDQLKTYTGTYYSPELETYYTISLKEHELFLGHIKYNDSKLKFTSNDNLTTDFWWMGQLLMLRDKKGKITGFNVNAGRVMHVRFNKVR